MINRGKKSILGVEVDAIDYEYAVHRIITCARNQERCTTSALAVHGVTTGVFDSTHRYRLNNFDLVTPDGMPVRWALNLLYKTGLPNKVSGPYLTLMVCEEAARQQLPVYLYGSSDSTVEKFKANLLARYPNLIIAGVSPSRFRQITDSERTELVDSIRDSGAKILLVGLGCPRQEIFTYEMGRDLKMPILAIGAAFDYHAGLLKDTPGVIQNLGLQWLHRVLQDPRRLWRRYLITNTQFVILLAAQWLRIWRPDANTLTPPASDLMFG